MSHPCVYPDLLTHVEGTAALSPLRFLPALKDSSLNERVTSMKESPPCKQHCLNRKAAKEQEGD